MPLSTITDLPRKSVSEQSRFRVKRPTARTDVLTAKNVEHQAQQIVISYDGGTSFGVTPTLQADGDKFAFGCQESFGSP